LNQWSVDPPESQGCVLLVNREAELPSLTAHRKLGRQAGSYGLIFDCSIFANFKSLIKTAESSLGCENSAKDAVQTTLVKVWKNIATFDPEKGTLESLLFFSVKRAALDHLKSRKLKFKKISPTPANVQPRLVGLPAK